MFNEMGSLLQVICFAFVICFLMYIEAAAKVYFRGALLN
jgi:hypothetical protein